MPVDDDAQRIIESQSQALNFFRTTRKEIYLADAYATRGRARLAIGGRKRPRPTFAPVFARSSGSGSRSPARSCGSASSLLPSVNESSTTWSSFSPCAEVGPTSHSRLPSEGAPARCWIAWLVSDQAKRLRTQWNASTLKRRHRSALG